MIITDEMLENLRGKIRSYVTRERTYEHILGTEKAAYELAKIYLPEEMHNMARAAALLHDITKNLTVDEHMEILRDSDCISEVELRSPKLLHSKSAAALIPADFPEFDDSTVVSAVFWHTTGHDGMTVFEMLIYLADYIEETRTFPDCIALRNYFFDNINGYKTECDKFFHLYKTMVKSFDYTIGGLIEDETFIDNNTVECRNYCLQMLRSK